MTGNDGDPGRAVASVGRLLGRTGRFSLRKRSAWRATTPTSVWSRSLERTQDRETKVEQVWIFLSATRDSSVFYYLVILLIILFTTKTVFTVNIIGI